MIPASLLPTLHSNLWNDVFLLLILEKRWLRQVTGKVKEWGLFHLHLVLLSLQQAVTLFFINLHWQDLRRPPDSQVCVPC